jgi:Outer membrane protein
MFLINKKISIINYMKRRMLPKVVLGILFLIFGFSYAQAQERYKLTMTLEEVTQTAREQSLSALIAKHTFLADYWQFRTYRAKLLPSLNLGANLGNYDRSLRQLQNPTTGEIDYIENNNMTNSLVLSVDQRIGLTGGTLSVQTNLNRVDQFSAAEKVLYNSSPINIYYNQPIRGYNSLKWEKKIEPVRYESAKRTYLEAIENVNITVTTLFFDVLSAQMSLEMAQKNYESSELNLKIAEDRFELGSITNSDLMQLRLRVYNDKLAISDNKILLDQSMMRLRSYLGYNDNVDIELIIPDKGPDVMLDFYDVLARAEENSAYLLDNELRIMSAEQEVARAKSSSGLQATLSARFGMTQKGNTLSAAYTNPMDQEILGLSLSIPILDWGLGRGSVKVAKSREEVIRTQVDQLYSQYRQDIMIRVMQFNNQNEQCEISLQADSLARRRYEVTSENFRNGTITVLDLNTAQSEKDQAARRYITDLNNYWQYYFNIRKLSLYDYLRNEEVGTDFEKLTGER